MMANSFVFYESFYDAISDLDDADQLALYRAICEYAMHGVVPEFSGICSAVFKLVRPQIDANLRRRENGAKGGRPKAEDKQKESEKEPNHNLDKTKNNLDKTTVEPNVNVNANVNVNVKEKGDKKKSEPRFAPPTADEVRAFCQEKGYRVDAERFVDFYASKGWMVGKNKMKDWKAAVRGWASREKNNVVSGTKFTNFSSERRTDYDELERKLIAQSMGV